VTEYQKYPGRLDEENPDSFDAGSKGKNVLYEEVEVSPGVRKMLPTALGALLQELLDRTPELQDGSIPVAVDGGINVTNLTNVDWESTWMEDLDAGGNRLALFERRTKLVDGVYTTTTHTVAGAPYVVAGASQRVIGDVQSLAALLTSILNKLIASPATAAGQADQKAVLDNILAKIIVAPATEAKQDTLNTAFGTRADASAPDDTGNYSSMSFTKRMSAALTSANSWLQSILGRLPVLGPRTSANSMPITPATDATWPVRLQTISNRSRQKIAAVSTNTAAPTPLTVPGSATHCTLQNQGSRIWYTLDGTNPAVSTGFYLDQGGFLYLESTEMGAFRAITETVSSLEVYYCQRTP
jgi:hypothetical protein